MKLIENIKKKLFTELTILEQRRIEDFNITRCKVFGTIRPRIFVDGIINLDAHVEIYNGNKKIYEKDYKKEEKEISIIKRISLLKPSITLIVSHDNKVLIKYNVNNSLIRKILKKIYTICKLTYRAIRLLWRKHHFIVPPKMWAYYLGKLKEKLQWEESSIAFLNPFDIEEYNEWIVKHEIHDEVKKLDYNPKISIIVPVYNAPINYLEECIDSVIDQNYENWELCIADDKSTDPEVKKTLEKYKKNILKVFGTDNLLVGDQADERQKKMLAGRRISGKYQFEDGTIFTYTGEYEHKLLEFLDKVMGFNGDDIVTPGPMFKYTYKGEEHTWITDVLIVPYNLVIDVKDGGSNPNKRSMPEYRAKQDAKEKMITDLGTYSYLRLTNNQFEQLIEVLYQLKISMIDDNDENRDVVISINEMAHTIQESIKDLKKELGGI